MARSPSKAGKGQSSSRGKASGGASKGGRKPASKPRRPQKPKPRKPKPPLALRLLKWGFALTFIGAVLGALGLWAGYQYYSYDLPDLRTVDDYNPPEITRVLAADGTVIAELYKERRTVVTREEIPEVMVQAMLSAEDADFYNHEGLDYMGMARALVNALKAGRLKGSGSTITQQTVKTFLLTPEKSFHRKAREIILARRLEQHLSKDEILTLYLNQIYFGHGRYGVQEAARFYFGKDIGQVSVAEAALIAGLVQSPNRLTPHRHMKRALKRRAYVLDQMVKNGHLKAAEGERLKASTIELAEIKDDDPAWAGWFVDRVRRMLVEAHGSELIFEGGLTIETTLDPARQKAALVAARQGLQGLDARQKYVEKLAVKTPKQRKAWRARRTKRLKSQAPPMGQSVPALIKAVDDKGLLLDLGVGQARVPPEWIERFTGIEEPVPFKVGAVVRTTLRADGPKHPEIMQATLDIAPQAAVVVVDPVTREVKALVGGYTHEAYPYDRAWQARRQPGSAFKPFVFGAALEQKRITPWTMLLDTPETWPGGEKTWKPKNYTQKYKGEITAREALAKSVNSIAVRLLDQTGVKAVQRFAQRAGITSPLTDHLPLALGASEVSPIELANAMATIAADGRKTEPRLITAIVDARGKLLDSPLTPAWSPEEVMDPAVAWLVRDLMREVVLRGSGSKLKGFARPVVGKTGTTNNAKDTWFVGLLPDVVVVAWLGFDDGRPLGKKETGGRTAVPVVKAYLEAAEAKGAGWPDPPEGLERVSIDPKSGLRAPEGFKKARDAWFLEGTAPTEMVLAEGEIDAGNFFFDQMGDGAEPTGGFDGGFFGDGAFGDDFAPGPDVIATARPAPPPPEPEGDRPKVRPETPETPQADPPDEDALPDGVQDREDLPL